MRPLGDAAPAPLRRSAARLVTFALVGLFALQIVQLSIFNTIAAPPATARPTTVAVGATTPVVTARQGATTFDWINIAVLLGIVLSAIAWTDSRQRLRAFRWPIGVAALYGVAIALASFTNIPDAMSARNVQTLIIPLTIVSLAAAVPALLDPKDYSRLFHGVVALLVVTAVASLWVVVTPPASLAGHALVRVDDRGGRLVASALFVHRNVVGSIVEFGPALIVYLMSQVPARRRAWYGVALAIVGTHLLLTFSRSSQLVAAVSLLPWLWRSRRRMKIVLALAVTAAAVATIGVVAVPEFRTYAGLGVSLSSRPQIWRAFWQLGLERPWLGYGLRNAEYRIHGSVYGPHSAYLAQFVYFGVCGLTLFLATLATFGRRIATAMQGERSPSLVALLLVGVLLQGGVESFLGAPVLFANSMFWICVGFAARPLVRGAY